MVRAWIRAAVRIVILPGLVWAMKPADGSRTTHKDAQAPTHHNPLEQEDEFTT
jgi:hypothetical protein